MTAALTSIEPTAGISSNLKQKLPTIVIGSLSLVVGLIWNDSLKALIDYYTPEKYKNSGNPWIKIIYATILTIIVIIVISLIIRFSP